MAKRVYKPNPVLDTTLFLSSSILAAYVIWQYFKEGVLFWTLIISTALVSILVPIVEYFLRVGGQWFSRTFLNDERHQDPLSKVYALKKFVDQGWQFVYHSIFSLWEYCLLRKYNWFEDGSMWYPITDDLVVPMDIRIVFTVQISLWLYQAYRHVFVNQRKKDYYELFLHHIVTLSLCYYAQRTYYGFGLIILFLHDNSDIFVDSLKLINLCKIDGLADYFILEITYICTLIVWVYERLYTLPIVFWKKATLGMRAYYSELTVLQIFKKEPVFCLEVCCCWVLYFLHIWWFALLLRLGFRGFVKDPGSIRKVAKEGYEGASDDEDEDEDEKSPISSKQKKE